MTRLAAAYAGDRAVAAVARVRSTFLDGCGNECGDSALERRQTVKGFSTYRVGERWRRSGSGHALAGSHRNSVDNVACDPVPLANVRARVRSSRGRNHSATRRSAGRSAPGATCPGMLSARRRASGKHGAGESAISWRRALTRRGLNGMGLAVSPAVRDDAGVDNGRIAEHDASVGDGQRLAMRVTPRTRLTAPMLGRRQARTPYRSSSA